MSTERTNQQVNVATNSSTKEHHDHHRDHDNYNHDHHRSDVNEIETKLMANWLKWLIPFLITALLAGIASIYDRITTLETGTFHNELIDHRLKTLESYHKRKDKK